MELLERFYAAETVFFASGGSDFAPVAAMLADDVVVHQADGLPWGGEYEGRDAFRRMFGEMASHWADLAVLREGAEYMVGPDAVTVLTAIEARTHAGEDVRTPFCQVFRFRDGVIAEIWPYWWDTATISAKLAEARHAA
jgi:ketosteroid isomerase-like protein